MHGASVDRALVVDLDEVAEPGARDRAEPHLARTGPGFDARCLEKRLADRLEPHRLAAAVASDGDRPGRDPDRDAGGRVGTSEFEYVRTYLCFRIYHAASTATEQHLEGSVKLRLRWLLRPAYA